MTYLDESRPSYSSFTRSKGFRSMLTDTCVKLKRLGYTVTQHDGDIVSAVMQRIRSRDGSDACE
jgi:hypothetical protein